jgi:hypothetical protein
VYQKIILDDVSVQATSMLYAATYFLDSCVLTKYTFSRIFVSSRALKWEEEKTPGKDRAVYIGIGHREISRTYVYWLALF